MSEHSPQSSAGRGPASSPFGGTDPTLYSPELARDTKHRRGNPSVATVVGRGKKDGIDTVFEKAKILPQPEPNSNTGWVNEILHTATNYLSRYMMVARLPDGTHAGTDIDHELVTVQTQMKLVSVHVLLLLRP